MDTIAIMVNIITAKVQRRCGTVSLGVSALVLDWVAGTVVVVVVVLVVVVVGVVAGIRQYFSKKPEKNNQL